MVASTLVLLAVAMGMYFCSTNLVNADWVSNNTRSRAQSSSSTTSSFGNRVAHGRSDLQVNTRTNPAHLGIEDDRPPIPEISPQDARMPPSAGGSNAPYERNVVVGKAGARLGLDLGPRNSPLGMATPNLTSYSSGDSEHEEVISKQSE